MSFHIDYLKEKEASSNFQNKVDKQALDSAMKKPKIIDDSAFSNIILAIIIITILLGIHSSRRINDTETVSANQNTISEFETIEIAEPDQFMQP